jgi:chromosome segregation ATPase
VTRMASQQELITRVEARLNALHTLSGEVDNRMEAQIVRRNEVESLHNRIEGIALAVMDAQQKLEAMDAIQTKVGPLSAEVATLRSDLETVYDRFAAAQQEESAINAQEKRLIEMLAASREAALEAAQRFEQVQGLADDLRRSSAIKDELLQELAQVVERQREVASQAEAAETQLARIEAASRALEHRRAQLAHSEQRITTFEARAAELAQLTEDLDARIADLTNRDAVVDAIRQEVAGVQEITARIRADLDVVLEQRDGGIKKLRKAEKRTA